MRPGIESQHVAEELSHLLASADPVAGMANDRVRRTLIAEVARAATSSEARIASRRRPRRSLVLGIAILLVASASTFASVWFGSDTKEFPQIVDRLLSSDDLEIPLPPGATRAELAEEIVTEGQRDPGLMTETFVISTFVYKARCAWEGHWLTSYEQGDEPQMDRAAQVLSQVPTWPTVAATDGGGMVQVHQRIARAAAAGRPMLLQQDFELNCAGQASN